MEEELISELWKSRREDEEFRYFFGRALIDPEVSYEWDFDDNSLDDLQLSGIERPIFRSLRLGSKNLKIWGQKFEQLLKRYQISDVIDSATASGLANDRVFRLESGWDWTGGGGVISLGWKLVAGFIEGADEYYLAKIPFDEEPEDGYRELRVSCIVCYGDGEECWNCEQGELVFELYWDDYFVVYIELSSW